MSKNKSKKAVTLIELIVWIGIITFIAIGASQLNFNTLNNRQKLEIFSNNIISQFEQIRNDALLGKWIWTNLITPEQWRIDYSNNSSGAVHSYYLTGSWYWSHYENIIWWDGFSINNFQCYQIDWTTLEYTLWNNETASIYFNNGKLNLSGSCTPSSKILEFDVHYNNFSDTIKLNSLNGLIEIKK